MLCVCRIERRSAAENPHKRRFGSGTAGVWKIFGMILLNYVNVGIPDMEGERCLFLKRWRSVAEYPQRFFFAFSSLLFSYILWSARSNTWATRSSP